MRIKKLPDSVANQIAAGEVIERPASVVKELLENALDAQADTITIELGYGGLNQIRISDNGHGIMAEDLPLAIAAHATSKISNLMDLYSISSMGFRGEALASIASIAKLTITSRPDCQPHGMMMESKSDDIILTPCARNRGTTIDVKDIFYNAPVRKRFLKGERAEYLAIEQVVKRFALSASHIAIELSHNGKRQLHLPAALDESSRLLRITRILGKLFIEQSHVLYSEHAGMALEGWISNVDYQRSQNDKLWVYINGRMVKDKLVNHAIKQAYEDVLYPGRHPACLLYFTIDPGEVDVNVHPTKHEVRFQQPRLIHDFICSRIRNIIAVADGTPDYRAVIPAVERHYEVREPRPATLSNFAAQYTMPIAGTNDAANWCMLNERFALIFLEQQPYLVDVQAVQKQLLLEMLESSAIPLSKRPLLVPLQFELPENIAVNYLEWQSLWQNIGLETVMHGNALKITTLPACTPNLALAEFFNACYTLASPTISHLIALLADYSVSNSLTAAEKQEVITYLHRAGRLPSLMKPMNLQACLEVFNA